MSDDNTLEYNNVSNPKHYCGSVSLECIDVMRVSYGDIAVGNFCICNAFKYMWRYKYKNGREDLDKAHWYLEYAKQILKEVESFSYEGDIDSDGYNFLYNAQIRSLNLYNRIVNSEN